MERTLRFLGSCVLLVLGCGAIAAPQYNFFEVGNTVLDSANPPSVGLSADNAVSWAIVSRDFVQRESFVWRSGIKTDTTILAPPLLWGRLTPGGNLWNSGYYFNGVSGVAFGLPQNVFNLDTPQVGAFNDSGTGVGFTRNPDGFYIGYVFQNGKPTLTNAPGNGQFRVQDINQGGEAIGWGDNSGTFGPDQVYLWKNGQYRNVTSFVTNPSQVGSSTWRINDVGTFAGKDRYYVPDGNGGYIAKRINDFGDGRQLGIADLNNANWSVGAGVRFTDGSSYGFVSNGVDSWKLTEVTAFPTGASQIWPTAINDNGWIAGYYLKDNQYHAFAMQPVPEPLTLLTLGIGVAALRRRRK